MTPNFCDNRYKHLFILKPISHLLQRLWVIFFGEKVFHVFSDSRLFRFFVCFVRIPFKSLDCFPQKIFSTVMSFEATSYHSIFPKNFQLGFQKSRKLLRQDFFAAAKHFSVIVGVKIVNSCMLLMVHTLVSQPSGDSWTWFSLSPTPD